MIIAIAVVIKKPFGTVEMKITISSAEKYKEETALERIAGFVRVS